ncbi:hypothetical protein IV500_12305 [Paeniglutamicibacter antarcticus]|uniref:Secreted protein n=1 Tax=Arthrobacter terrae TaxID=2935737 RepID=A0A931CNJ3_9MICC|nr:hypothetical protein [Arthrobacter terrae]MBG0740162.1 hypothetical protein [Arthrobacter terrae]
MDAATVLLILLLIIVVVVGAGVTTAGVLLYRGGRGVARRVAPVSRARRGALVYRTRSSDPQRRGLAVTRLQLQDSLAATNRSLSVAVDSRQQVGNLGYIVQTLNHAGSVLDRQLAVAEKDPDPAIQRLYAQTLGTQSGQVLHTCAGVRQALARTSQPMTAVDISTLTRRLDVEAKVLDNWAATYTRLGNP